MQYQQGSLGRVFALRLEEGDRLPDTLEAFAKEQAIQAAMVIYVGAPKGAVAWWWARMRPKPRPSCPWCTP
jgi:predicted DNA-binding protein with PD1-like motif